MKRISLGILWRWVKRLVIGVVAPVLLLLAGCNGAQIEPTMTPTSGFVEIEGARIYYETMGKGHPPVVLIHGGAIDSRMWDSQFEAFAKHYLVVRYDVPGLGKSQAPTHEFSHAALLRNLLKSLNIDRAHIVGHSLGSIIAADFAVEYPEMVTSLVLDGPAVNGYPWSSELIERIYAIYEVGKEKGARQAAEKWLEDPYMIPAMENPAIRERVRQLTIDNAKHFIQNVPARGASPPVIDRLDAIFCSTLIVVGDRDVPDMLASADALEKGIVGAKKTVIKNAGHLIPMEKPEEFNQLVLDFLGRQPKPSDTSKSVPSSTLESVHKLFELDGSPGPVWSLAWSPDGSMLASAGFGQVKLWDAKTRKGLGTLQGHTDDVWGVAWSPDGSKIASSGQDGMVRLWDAKTREGLATFETGKWTLCVTWSPDGSRLASGSSDGDLQVWDVKIGEVVRLLIGAKGYSVISVAWSPDGRILAAGQWNGVVYLWNAEIGEQLASLVSNSGERNDVNGLAWSPDGHMLASAHQDGKVRLWSLADSKVPRILGRHSGAARGLAWSPNGRFLASTGIDSAVRLWDVKTGQQLSSLEDLSLWVLSVAWSPDGKKIAAGNGKYAEQIGGAVVVWAVP